jgi:hypothetical protein
MTIIKLKKAIKARKQITYEKKPDLHAIKCDGCGMIFQMEPFHNDFDLAVLKGTFSGFLGKKGNQFSAHACSFKCADDIVNGKWKEMEEYKCFKRVHAFLARYELKLTPYIKNEDKLINAWELNNNT